MTESDQMAAALRRKQAALLVHLARTVSQLAVGIPWQDLAREDSETCVRAERLLRGAAAMIRAALESADVA